jgi:hypothetical protein
MLIMNILYQSHYFFLFLLKGMIFFCTFATVNFINCSLL